MRVRDKVTVQLMMTILPKQYGGGGGGGAIEEDRDDGQIREKRDEYHEKVLTMEKCHGKCGSYTHEDGTHFIGDFNEEARHSS